MTNPHFGELKGGVEEARAKLVSSIANFREGGTPAEVVGTAVKAQIANAKDALLENALAAGRSKLTDAWEITKAKAAANPAAALAIGAGIAWRLFRHPPIATTLIGAGLVGLLKSTPATEGDTRDYLAHAKDRLAEQASDFVGAVTKGTGEAVQVAKEKVVELTEASVGQDRLLRTRLEQGGMETKKVSQPLPTALDREARDNLLLGLAGVAVAGAMGFALRRRQTEHLESTYAE